MHRMTQQPHVRKRVISCVRSSTLVLTSFVQFVRCFVATRASGKDENGTRENEKNLLSGPPEKIKHVLREFQVISFNSFMAFASSIHMGQTNSFVINIEERPSSASVGNSQPCAVRSTLKGYVFTWGTTSNIGLMCLN